MAYNSGYNPDALPAHAEPEQAAQIISQQQQQPQPNPNRPRPGSLSSSQAYNNGPQPSYQTRPPTLNAQPAQQLAPQQYPKRRSPSNSNPPPNNYNYTQPPNSAPLPQNYQAPTAPQNYQPQIAPQNYQVPGAYAQSPPPQNYGFGPPPQQPHGRSPPASRPPATPAPGAKSAADASLFPLFKAVDKSGTGQLTEKELRAALVNGDWTSFDPHTVKMMIRMFDVDKTGTINFDEFCGLWSFLAAWRNLFDRFDEDRSGYISFDEYSKALVAFGYRLSSTFVGMLFRTYEKGGGGNMSFDLFVQSCISLKRMTDVFKRYDVDRDGYITLSFEEFLTGECRLWESGECADFGQRYYGNVDHVAIAGGRKILMLCGGQNQHTLPMRLLLEANDLVSAILVLGNSFILSKLTTLHREGYVVRGCALRRYDVPLPSFKNKRSPPDRGQLVLAKSRVVL